MKSRLTLLLASAALALPLSVSAAGNNAAGANAAGNDAAASQAQPGAHNADTDKALSSLHKINLEEIDMGKMAHDQGHSQAVKDYADRLVNDHSASDDKVVALAKQLGVNLPDKDALMTEKDHNEMKTLKAKQGAAFDKAFAQAMVKGHAGAITSLQALQPKLSGPAAQLVSETLPVIREHLQIAQKIASSGQAARAPENTKAKAE
jgi:putative membrane protein